jgi:hypothetical protein
MKGIEEMDVKKKKKEPKTKKERTPLVLLSVAALLSKVTLP